MPRTCRQSWATEGEWYRAGFSVPLSSRLPFACAPRSEPLTPSCFTDDRCVYAHVHSWQYHVALIPSACVYVCARERSNETRRTHVWPVTRVSSQRGRFDWSRRTRAATTVSGWFRRGRERGVRSALPTACAQCVTPATAIFVKWVTFVDLCEMWRRCREIIGDRDYTRPVCRYLSDSCFRAPSWIYTWNYRDQVSAICFSLNSCQRERSTRIVARRIRASGSGRLLGSKSERERQIGSVRARKRDSFLLSIRSGPVVAFLSPSFPIISQRMDVRTPRVTSTSLIRPNSFHGLAERSVVAREKLCETVESWPCLVKMAARRASRDLCPRCFSFDVIATFLRILWLRWLRSIMETWVLLEGLPCYLSFIIRFSGPSRWSSHESAVKDLGYSGEY